ncbi:MAG: type II CRISPR RNA-guided endonuclease Cas9 [Chlorobi bacterium]|jgi:CRISPR-associated endonuclease Csn1|nr:type II CRISPR RNA-guided endonuclease Cas9 [Chlorobiota bacterium]
MERSLGLDVGANSIGWAVIEQTDSSGSIRGCGVYVFPEGVENLGQGERELSLNATRRGARQRRRQLFRKKLRKRALLRLLIEHGLCPHLSDDELRHWQKTGAFPDRDDIRQWLRLNPYQLRARAATGEPLQLHELGRIFYHIAQRRGFPSKSRSASADDSSVIERGDPKLGKAGIEQTRALITPERPTIGAALAQLYPPEGEPFTNGRSRVRNRYTDRQMYIDEFEHIWNAQRPHHPDVLTDELKTALGGRRKDGYPTDGVLFFQRPLRSQKHLVGRCTFEPSKPRCQRSHPLFERFRALQFITTITCNDLPLDADDRAKALRLLLSKKKVTFADIRKALKKTAADDIFNYADEDSIAGSPTNAALAAKNIFGAAWFDKSDDEQHRIWHALQSFDDIDKLAKYATEKLGLSNDAAQRFAKISLTDGYASLSLKAIRTILPFLEQGYPYHIAVALAGVRRALGKKWDELDDEQRKTLCDTVESLVGSGIRGGYRAALEQLLREQYGLGDQEIARLYHHSDLTATTQLLDRIPTDEQFTAQLLAYRNPIVTNVLFALRRLVNELLQRYGRFDRITIELARDLKRSKAERQAIRREQQRNEIIRATIADILAREGIEATAENILKYRLWLECGKTCPYSNRPIGFHQLFNGEVQIEHIFPYDRSLDDSFLNKTLCFADVNRQKGNRTPYEYFTQNFGPDKWNEVKHRLQGVFRRQSLWDKNDPLNYFPDRRKKYERFIAEKLPADFAARQLNDTRIASVRAREMLQLVCPTVTAALGPTTARLRRFWGIENVLDTGSGSDGKERSDHRHHALDAIVLSCTRQSHIQLLSTASARTQRHHKPIPEPWDRFRYDVEHALQGCVVVHHRSDRVLTRRTVTTQKNGKTLVFRSLAARDQLHKETFYGQRTDPETGTIGYHVRKPLQEITKQAQVEKIVDPVVRALVEQRIAEAGGYQGDAVPKGAFFGTSPDGSPQPLVFLPNRRGEPVPVLKVRLRESLANARPVKPDINCYVNPSNNHHAVVYRFPDGQLGIEVVQFWDAVFRQRRGEPLYQVPAGCELVMTLHINDMVLLGCSQEDFDRILAAYPPDERGRHLAPYLHKVQKLSQSSPKQWELCFRHHADARPVDEAKHDYILIRNWGTGKQGWETYNPIKLRITPSGMIFRWGELPDVP